MAIVEPPLLRAFGMQELGEPEIRIKAIGRPTPGHTYHVRHFVLTDYSGQTGLACFPRPLSE